MTEIFDVDGLEMYLNENHRFGTDAVLLAEFIKAHSKDILCDLCTGCGIIPVLLSKNKDIPRKIYALDISGEAIELLENTIGRNKLKNIDPILEDLKTAGTGNSALKRESMDIVSANPPYFKANSGKTRKTPEQSNARHELVCELADVVRTASRLLKYGGYLKMCHIPQRLCDVVNELKEQKLEPKEIVFVHSKDSKEPWLFLISAKKGGRSGVKIRFESRE